MSLTNRFRVIKQNPLLKRALSDTNYYAISQIGVKLLSLAIIPWLTRKVSINDFGLYDLFFLYSGVLSLVIGMGFDSGIAFKIIEAKDDYKKLNNLFNLTATVTLLAFIVLCLGLGVYAYFLGFSEYPNWFILATLLYTISYQGVYLSYNFLRWIGNAKMAAMQSLVSSAIGLILGVLFMMINPKIEHYIYGLLAGMLLSLFYSWYALNKFIRPALYLRIDKEAKDLFKLSLPYLPTYLSSYLMQFVDRLLLTNFYSIKEVGLYGLCYRIGQIPNFILQIANKGFQPVIFSNYDNEDGKRLAKKLMHLFFLSLIPVTVLIWICSKWMVGLFGGEQYTNAAMLLPYTTLSILIIGSNMLGGIGYNVKRKTLLITYNAILAVVLIVLFSYLLMPVFGFISISIATYLAAVFSSLGYHYFSEKLYRVGYSFRLIIGTQLIVLLINVLFTLIV